MERAAAGLVETLVATLAERGETIAVAESLTGGLLAATLVNVPGVSRVFRGGLVVYATDLKASLADVSDDLLASRGPVDPDVARALARGARSRCRADWGLGTTGVAGPDPQDDVTVGTVFLAVAPPPSVEVAGRSDVRALALTGDRAVIRQQSVIATLDLLADWLRPVVRRAR